MNSHEELELKKEFQLERIILFSDAVFAIILTIMVIDLKLPETIREASADEFKHAFNKMYIQLVGYALSFFFVAMFWTRHVKLFGFVKDYNRALLIFNLIFLFTVSLFPFAVSMVTGFNKVGSIQAHWGFNIYVVVIFTCMLTYSILSGYLVKNKEKLCYGADVIESQLKWKVLRANYVIIPIIFILLAGLNFFNTAIQYFAYVIAIYGIATARANKHYYPKSIGDSGKPIIARMFARRQKKSRVAKLPPGE